MDPYLLSCYRFTWSEFLLIYDAAIFYHKKRPQDKTIKEFSTGLHSLLKAEMQTSDGPGFVEEDENIDISDEATLRRLLWQFTHGVVFEFLAEEISQYPFWAAKVVSVVKKDFRANLNVLTSAFQFFEQTFARGGIRALFEGNVPYLAASVVLNYQYFHRMLKGFLQLYDAQLPRRSSSGSLMSSSKYNSNKIGKRRRSIENAKKKATEASSWSIMSTLNRLSVAALVHPLLTLSVRMLTDPTLASQNWLSAYWTLVTTQGIPVLYTGLKISFLLGAIPLQKPMYLLGIPETVLFRRMSGEGTADSLSGSYSVLYSALVKEGTLGLVGYGILSAAQVVPGFVSFIASKWLVWLLCGSSRQRERQLRKRRAALEAVWTKKVKAPPGTQTDTQTEGNEGKDKTGEVRSGQS